MKNTCRLTLCEGWLTDAAGTAFFSAKRRYFRLEIRGGSAQLSYFRDAEATDARFTQLLTLLRSVALSRSDDLS